MIIHADAFTLKNLIAMENYFAQFKRNISPEREQEIYDTFLNLLDMSYPEYKLSWWMWWLWLPQMFYDFWFLVREWKPKALEIRQMFVDTHWKQDDEIWTDAKEKDKIGEIHINKQNYCGKLKLDPKNEVLVKIKDFETLDDKFYVIWITWINNEWKSVCWWTTLVSKNETPKVYGDIYSNYKRYYEN